MSYKFYPNACDMSKINLERKYQTCQMVTKAGGSLNIRSGNAKLFFDPQGSYDISNEELSFGGTQIGVSLPRKEIERKEF